MKEALKIMSQYIGKHITILLVILSSFFFYSCTKSEKFSKLDHKIFINDSLYLINNQLAKDRIRKMESKYNLTNKNIFRLIHISDTHISDYSESCNTSFPINLIQAINFANQPDLNIDAMVNTGDFIQNHPDKKEALKYLQSFFYFYYNNNHIPSLYCTGNHDSNIIENSFKSYISPTEIYQKATIALCPFILKGNKIDHNYYYTDIPNPQGGYIRFIALDMLDQKKENYNTTKNVSYTKEQINWLGNIALKENITDNHSIIILNHYPFQPYQEDASTFLCDGDYVHEWNMIPDIIEAFRNKKTIQKYYKNKFIEKDSLNINFNFTHSKGHFICYLGGHTHSFGIFNIPISYINKSQTKPQQMILCTNQGPDLKGKVYNRVERLEDTLSSNSFNIYYIDTKDKKIYITFFGAYIPENDKDFPEVIVLSY